MSSRRLAAIEDGAERGCADVGEGIEDDHSSIGLFGSRVQLGDDYLARAVAAQMGIYGNSPRKRCTAAGRLRRKRRTARRRQDATHSGSDKVALPEAKFFWSLTLYRLPSRLLAANPIDRYSIGDRTPGIANAEDGSLEIALQSAEPTNQVRRANWLPTPAGEPFTVIYRLYGPGEQAQSGAWSLPPISPA